MSDLVILSAGKGTRMKSDVPKALHIIDDKGTSNIQNTININKELFDNIYVVVNCKDEALFSENIKNAKVLGIDSGLGSGHAIFETIKKYKISDEFLLVWGDAVFVNDKLTKELLAYPTTHAVIPVYETLNPYISFKVTDKLKAKSVDFSKYGENNDSGLQDKCIFKLNNKVALSVLKMIHNATFKDGRYITESKEFEFLYFIHAMASKGKQVQCYITEYENSIFSYNNKEELDEIKNILSDIQS